MDEQLYFVHVCGEAFDLADICFLHEHSRACDETPHVASGESDWKILPESEAM